MIAMMAMLLMSALGLALVLTTSSETMIAGNFRNSSRLYAADAGWSARWRTSSRSRLEQAARRLHAVRRSWTVRRAGALLDGSTIDLTQAINMANCQKVTTCSGPT